QERRLDADPLDGVAEAGTVLPALRDGAAELVVLDHDQVLEADPVGATRHAPAVVREAGRRGRRSGSRVELALDEIEPELVELLEVPAERAAGAVDLERV